MAPHTLCGMLGAKTNCDHCGVHTQDAQMASYLLWILARGDRLEEAKLELHRFSQSGVPVLILANKQDLPTAMDPRVMEEKLGLKDLCGEWHMQPSCAVTGDGLEDGLTILHDMIVGRKKAKKAAKGNVKASAKKLQRSHSHVC